MEQGGREVEVECSIGDVATVWDGEVAGMAQGLGRMQEGKTQGLGRMQEGKTLILADSQAAITTVRRAGMTGKAKSHHLQNAVKKIAEVKEKGGEVKIGWIEAHIGIPGNEAADGLQKGYGSWKTEGWSWGG